MIDFISILKEKPMYIGSKGATIAEIIDAETKLSVSFSKEYKHYLSSVGFAIYEGHELTGICKAKRLNVVDVTLSERNITPDVPADWYVIEQLNIDGIVIWQSTTGAIYQTSPNTKPKKICDSLIEYISM